ncbi:MAG: sigma 54-interacting transcriptional regulator, partial [Armatimonadetes bacterium]|nr:sigma 54-interacting transcriptional regulator [Armatimonadota bacterium]
MLNERMDFLRCHELWAGLPERSLQALAEAMSPTQHEEGDTIIAQGDSGSRLYVLVAGRAEARIPTPGGEVIVVAQFGEGDCFGEMSLLSGDAASADVVATERCRALSLDREAFDGLVVTDPRLLQGFVRVVTRRLRDTNRAVARAWDKGQEIVRFLHEQSPRYDAFVGTHPTIRELRSRLEDYSRREDPLVLQGERGVGKEFAARLIHQNSARSGGRLVSVDCARLAETPWGDPLFGAADRAEAAGAADGEVCFVALAEGGSILLKNVEALPPTIQERLVHFLSGEEEPTGVRARARVMATSRGEIEEAAAAGRVLPSLARLLTPHTIHLPPLRGRKRDVPALARHFVLKHAGRLKKPVVGLSDPALVKLVAYDYRLANVDELEQAIERAVIMSDDRLVDAPEVILGPPPEVRSRGLNLLRAPERIVALALRVFPGVFRGLAAAVFLGIIIHCFAERSRGGGHPALTLVWSLWWPLLALSFLLVGRAWCAVCPLALAGAAVQRLGRRKSRIPEKMTRYEAQIVMAGFLGIVWVEEATHMRHSPVATGFLLLSLLIGAVTASALLPRRAWCRHLCPLGGFAGLCSRAAALELRPTADVCAAKCKDHSCYK